MFYFFSKVLIFLINPLCWIIFLLIYLFRTTSKKRKKIAFYSSLLILIFTTNEIILNEFLLKWEIGQKRVENLQETYDYGLVLTGDSNRFYSAISMFRKGKVKNICIIGRQPNENLKDQLINAGIPEEHLFLEPKSQNTYQHSLFFKDFLDDVQPLAFDTSTFIMISSAYHMRRAKMCFDKQNIDVSLFRTNSKVYDRKYYKFLDIIPTAQAMYYWEKIIKECFGIIAYKVVGYI